MPPSEISRLYGGEIEVRYSDGNHRYHVSGSATTSVTQILDTLAKPGLIYWAVGKMAEDLRAHVGEELTPYMIEEASKSHIRAKDLGASTGREVHSWCEQWIKGKNPEHPTDERIMNGVLGFLRWVNAHGVTFEHSERIIYSKAHGYVGCADAVAVIDGTRRLVDFKTSKAFRTEMRYQTAAYQKALEEEGFEFGGPRVIVRFDKETGDFDVREPDGLEEDFQAFLGLLAAKRREKELTSWV